ncbi:hypothetical protein [Cohnella panacarvi]|uniref:hypothetical protein n=1 Tax=Cohnella panacarvi TaxID=400776 RepID=UPI0004B954B3|nr:hypothetical protein [Cohnella panacarvi]
MMYDVHRVEVLPELLTLSLNFKEPIGVLANADQPYTVTGIVEEIDDTSVLLEGRLIQLSNIVGVEP